MDKFQQDRMLLLQARAGDNIALEKLLNNYKPMVNSIARGYFLTDGDFDDLLQEGMIGLHKAFLSYDISGDTSFSTFAHLCITSQVQSAIRKSQNLKNSPLNNYLSITSKDKVLLGQEETEENDFYLQSNEPSPEDIVMMQESMDELNSKLKEKLSILEFNVLALYLKGYSYKDIAQKLSKDTKAVDNAINRIKDKLQFLKRE